MLALILNPITEQLCQFKIFIQWKIHEIRNIPHVKTKCTEQSRDPRLTDQQIQSLVRNDIFISDTFLSPDSVINIIIL